MEKLDLSQELESALSIIEKNISERNEMITVFETFYKSFYEFFRKRKFSESQPKIEKFDSSTNTEPIKLTLCSYRGHTIKNKMLEKKLGPKPTPKLNLVLKSETCKNLKLNSSMKKINFPK